jgi:hypothetical protein
MKADFDQIRLALEDGTHGQNPTPYWDALATFHHYFRPRPLQDIPANVTAVRLQNSTTGIWTIAELDGPYVLGIGWHRTRKEATNWIAIPMGWKSGATRTNASNIP